MAFTVSLNLRALVLAGALLLAAPVTAKTDIGGCVSSATKNQWGEASMIWYVPGTGEVCELLDCGGGRAPPKTNVPGCDNYKGTAEYQPTFLPGFGASGSAAEATATAKTSGGSSSGGGSGSTASASASPKPTGDALDTTMLTGTRNPPPVTSPAKTTATVATGVSQSETRTSTGAAGSADEASDAASATSPSAGAGAMPTAAPLGMFIGLVAGAVLF